MFKKLGMIGLAIAITLLIVSSAMADLSFVGGNITGRTQMDPTQSLVTAAIGPITGNQQLVGGNLMDLATDTMTGIVADNQYLNRATAGSINKAFAGRQATASFTTGTSHCAGLQNVAGSTTIGTNDYATLVGNGGNIRFNSDFPVLDVNNTSASITFGTLSQSTVHNTLALGTSMAQNQNTTAVINSPGNAGAALTLVATGDAAGVVGFGNTINSLTARNQEFSGNLVGNVGLYNGQMTDSDLIGMSMATEIGTITP